MSSVQWGEAWEKPDGEFIFEIGFQINEDPYIWKAVSDGIQLTTNGFDSKTWYRNRTDSTQIQLDIKGPEGDQFWKVVSDGIQLIDVANL